MHTSLRMLLADDNAHFLQSVQQHLHALPWVDVIATASNGLQAVTLTEQLHPDVILMDIAMPEMSGLQATRLVKALQPPPMVIITSHSTDTDSRDKALRAGCDAFVGKLHYLQDILPMLEALAHAKDTP
jgi:CheY-like chemotaxis protein